MQQDSGEIRDMADWNKRLGLDETTSDTIMKEQYRLAKLIPFAIGERFELEGCLFEVKEIREHPINELVLKILPQLFGLKNNTDPKGGKDG
jgi:hypothetical protein